MNYHSNLIRFFILAPILPGAIMLYTFFPRKLYIDTPWFTVYLGLIIASAPALFWLYQFASNTDYNMDYFYGAWIGEGWAVTIAFMVILDVIRCLMKDYESIRRGGITFVVLMVVVLSVIAVSVGLWGSVRAHPTIRTFLALERSVRIVQVGVLLSVFAFSSFLGLRWRNHVFGVALGYGLYAATDLAMITYVSHFGATSAYKALVIDELAYIVTIVTWTIYVLQGEPARNVVVPPSSREQLERWNQALAGIATK
jgi:hypothetical protein